jgi:aldehyde:ferredoxin oxidoreductase
MKLVRINLNTEKIRFEEITQESPYFLLGARGLTSQIIYDEVPPTCDPLGPNNKLILSNGILAGTPFPNSARTSVGAKSPLTYGIKEANVGGRPAMLLARRGIRALILEQISDDLKIIIINDDGIKVIPGIKYRGWK